MKILKGLILSIIFAIGLVTSVFAANPASKEYVDQQFQILQTQISNIQGGSGISYTAGAGIGIVGTVISNTLPGITYTPGTGISIVGTTITNSSPGITYTGGSGISVTGSTINAVGGYAEFIRTIQVPNNSVPPGTAFTIDTQVVNNITSSIVAAAGAGGTVYTLGVGTYVIDYEMSLVAASSVGLYTGPNAGSLTLDVNTVAGSTTGTTWIHGRAFEVVAGAPLVIAVSSVVGTAAIATAGTDAGSFMIRLTIMKIA